MRRSWVLVLLAAAAIPLGASKHMTVAQLQQALNTAISAHRPDDEIARQIGGFELTERLTEATLDRLKTRLVPGSQGAQALELLADRSAFLDPPASELPKASAPDSAEQTRIVEAARRYGSQTLPRLPDFFATRVINLYDDRPQALKKGEWPSRSGLHLIDTSSGEISVRNEREDAPATQGSAMWQANLGLVSGGEFGNTLSMILADTAKGTISWSHWEQSAKGRVAVFRYEVPASASHYEVLNAAPSNSTIIHTKPGYHGSIWIDPVDGTTLRITMDADLTRGAPFRRAAILVEYGLVDIAGTTFICPVRSLALSVALDDPETLNGDAPREWLNETHFTNYHRFASTTRILAGESAAPSAVAAPARTDFTKESAPHHVTSEEPETQVAEASPVGGQPPPPIAESPSTPAAKTQAPPAGLSQPVTGRRGEPPPAGVAPAQPVTEPAAATAAANASPAFTVAPPGNAPDSGVTLHVEVSELLIPAVVRDKQGHEVADLKKEDFQVFDNGKQQPISGFTVEKRRVSSNGTENVTQPPAPRNAALQPSMLPKRITVFLFDDLHLSVEDMARAKTAVGEALTGALAGSNMAAVISISGQVNSGLTHDTTELQNAIAKLQPRGLYRSNGSDCPNITYYQADLIENKHNSAALGEAVTQIFNCDPGLDRKDYSMAESIAKSAARQVLNLGQQDVRVTMASIAEFVRRMAALPGERTLILVSPGFLLTDPEALITESRIVDLAARSNVTISALDARGVYTTGVTASERVVGNPQMQSDFRQSAMTLAEDPMAELANGTGGTFFHNSNDLGAGFKRLTEVPEYIYVLEFSLNGVKPDGSYHHLKVKVDRDGMQMQARQGYTAPKQEKNKK